MIALICARIENQSDREFMEHLYQEFERTMFHTARQFTKNRMDQEDIVQDGILKLIKNIATIRPMGRYILASYIVFTIKNASIDFLRAQQVKQGKICNLEDVTFLEPESLSFPLEEQLISAERLAELWSYLSEEDRIIFEGKYFLGYTDEELAIRLQCQPGSIRMKLTRARRKVLKRIMDGKDGVVL